MIVMSVFQTIRNGIKSFIRCRTPFIEKMYMVWNGEKELRRIRNVYGEDTHVFLMRGATGDTYLQLAMMDNYIREQGISHYKIIGDSAGFRDLLDLFQERNFVVINGYKVESIEKAYMLLGSRKLNLTILFPWAYSLYFNRCRIRMTERFHFMDTYQYYVLNLKQDMQVKIPRFRSLTQKEQEKIIQKGVIKGKTVIIAPEANSITQLETELWNQVIVKLEEKGYAVLVNMEENEGYCAPGYFCAYTESVPLLEYAGFFIGLRSGFCDIVSTAKCHKVVIYPAKTAKADYSEHRTEIEFCGLKRMRLIEEKDDTLVEIDTALVRNITDTTDAGKVIQGGHDREYEKTRLVQKILDCFSDI